jgi:hypothetical protein
MSGEGEEADSGRYIDLAVLGHLDSCLCPILIS